jgi:hypothetical protein
MDADCIHGKPWYDCDLCVEDAVPICCLCGEPCEAWHAEPTGYGHNPDPLGVDGDRCCDACNSTYVIPARLRRIYG